MKITVALSLIVCTIFALQASYVIQKDDTDKRAALRLRVALTTEIQAVALSGPLWDYDQERALSSLEGMLGDPDVLVATVKDDAGDLFVRVVNSRLDLKKTSENSTFTTVRKIIFSRSKIEQRQVGSIIVKMSTARVDNSLRANIFRSGIITVLIMLVMVIGLTIAIRSFTKPIVDMTKIMRRRIDGDYSGDLEERYIQRSDEIGDIAKLLEQDQRNRRDEARLLETTSAIATQLNLDVLLRQIMEASSDLLNAERSTLFIYDKKKDLLWSRVAEGLDDDQIVLRPGEGIAGQVFQTGNSEIVFDPYSDSRFDNSVDIKTGFITRDILCLPIPNKDGKIIGVTQALNKRDGTFSDRDIQRLKSLTAQVSAAIENAQLFENVLSMKNYNESILRSLTNGVVSLDQDRRIQKLNSAAQRILGHSETAVEGELLADILGPKNIWLDEALSQVSSSGEARMIADSNLVSDSGDDVAVNLAATPLLDLEDCPNGFLAVLEDISEEKRVRGTMSRYMPSQIVDQLLEQAEDNLGGSVQTVTILFSDIRSFTTISERIGARATVAMLNEYFSHMVEIIEQHDGILDKYIGDAIMAIFGAPFLGDCDADNSVKTAYTMLDAVDSLNSSRIERGETSIKIGLGLNTGKVVLGNIGSVRRMDYTVIGDSVNLAARLESATKAYSTRLLISQFTFDALSDRLSERFRKIDLMRVKGKSQPVAIYEGLPENSILHNFSEQWYDALNAYNERDWNRSKASFMNVLDNTGGQNNGDIISKLYIDRIDRFIKEAPPLGWDGVYSMETK